MVQEKYYIASYAVLFIPAIGVLFLSLFTIMIGMLVDSKSEPNSSASKYLKNYTEILDIINFQNAKKSELELAARSFVKHFANFPQRSGVMPPDDRRRLEEKLEVVEKFAKNAAVTEDVREMFKQELLTKFPDYEYDVENALQKGWDKKNKS